MNVPKREVLPTAERTLSSASTAVGVEGEEEDHHWHTESGVISFPPVEPHDPNDPKADLPVSLIPSIPASLPIVQTADMMPDIEESSECGDSESTESFSSESSLSESSSVAQIPTAENQTMSDENTPLLHKTISSTVPENSQKENLRPRFWSVVFREKRVIAATFCTMAFAIILSSFDATIPLHVEEIFDWGPSLASLMFLALQGPSLVFAPICGILRDK